MDCGILFFFYASPNISSPLPNKSDVGQAADQTTVLLPPPKSLVYVSYASMRDDNKPVHRAQLKKIGFNSQRSQWRLISGELGSRNHAT